MDSVKLGLVNNIIVECDDSCSAPELDLVSQLWMIPNIIWKSIVRSFLSLSHTAQALLLSHCLIHI